MCLEHVFSNETWPVPGFWSTKVDFQIIVQLISACLPANQLYNNTKIYFGAPSVLQNRGSDHDSWFEIFWD